MPIVIDDSKHIFVVEPNGLAFQVVVPASLAEDCGYSFTDKASAYKWLVATRIETGNKWEILDKPDCIAHLYAALEDVPINLNDEIEDAYLHFEIGTTNTTIWHWFEEYFDIELATLQYKER